MASRWCYGCGSMQSPPHVCGGEMSDEDRAAWGDPSYVRTRAKRTPAEWWKLLEDACAAGRMAAAEAAVEPMYVAGGGRTYRVPGGPCGFAWVNVRGNTPFAAWLRRSGQLERERGGMQDPKVRAVAEARGGSWGKGYPGGLQFWVWHGGQSVARKAAYAEAMAKHLTEAGVPACAGSRLD